MTASTIRRLNLLGAAVLVFAVPRAPALLNFDGTRNQIFVFGNASLGYDSNIFSDSSGRGDYSVDTAVGIELKRRAGLIGVNANAKFDYLRYGKYSGESALNPNFTLVFDKASGRLTGSASLSAFRESRSESALNLRTDSWNYRLDFNLKYPLNEKFYTASESGFLRRQYRSTPGLVNYTEYSEGLDLFYVYSSKLDLVGGYKLRISRTSASGNTLDHWFNVGATGALLAKLSGTFRVGYQLRNLDTGQNLAQVNALAALSWPVTRKLGFTSLVSRDFNTIATGVTVDTTSVGVAGTYSYNRKLDLTAGVTFGSNRFVSLAPPIRRDNFSEYDLGAHYRVSDHLQLGATYSYFRNLSSVNFSDFDRRQFSFDIASRY